MTNRTENSPQLVAGKRGAASRPRPKLHQRLRPPAAKRLCRRVSKSSKVPDDLETARRQQSAGAAARRLRADYDDAFEAFERMNEHHAATILPTRWPRRRAYRDAGPRPARCAHAGVGRWLARRRTSTTVPRPFPRRLSAIGNDATRHHPDGPSWMEVLEEEPTLMHATDAEFGGFEAIPAASDDDVRQARSVISSLRVIADAARAGQTLVDKSRFR